MSLLIDMADQYHGNVALLGEFQQQRSALAYLRDTAGRTVHGLGHDGLYGIYDHQLRLLVTDVQEYLVERSLAHDHARRTGQEPSCPSAFPPALGTNGRHATSTAAHSPRR